MTEAPATIDSTAIVADLPPLANTPATLLGNNAILDSAAAFEHAQRVAKVFAMSKLVPDQFKNSIADCLIACQMARRLDIDPMMLMQNTSIVRGKPAMEGKLVIALLNSRGGFAHSLRFEYSGSGASRAVRCWTKEKDGYVLEQNLSMGEVKTWGWDKNDVWQKQPDQMLAYRSAAYFARKFRPELMLGLYTKDEFADMEIVDVSLPPHKRPAPVAEPELRNVATDPGPKQPPLFAGSVVAEKKRSAAETW